MYNIMLDKYYIYRSNIYHIDGKIIVKYCIESDKKTNTIYKSKKSIYKQ